MAQPMSVRLHGLGDRPQGLPLPAQRDHFVDSLLLGLIGDELAALAATEAERDLAPRYRPRAF